MNQQQILQVQMSKLEQELMNAYSEQASQQAKITDAATPTGNAAADTSLQQQATIATNTLAMLTRMIGTRTTVYSSLDTQMQALNNANGTVPASPRVLVSPPPAV
jgi:hypothetical protein